MVSSQPAVDTPPTRLRSSCGTRSYVTVVRIGLSIPAARPPTAIVTASAAVPSTSAATAKRGSPQRRNATVKTTRRGKRSPTAP